MFVVWCVSTILMFLELREAYFPLQFKKKFLRCSELLLLLFPLYI